jgi:hypothetical protein
LRFCHWRQADVHPRVILIGQAQRAAADTVVAFTSDTDRARPAATSHRGEMPPYALPITQQRSGVRTADCSLFAANTATTPSWSAAQIGGYVRVLKRSRTFERAASDDALHRCRSAMTNHRAPGLVTRCGAGVLSAGPPVALRWV